VSNILFFIVPPIACQLFKPYAIHVTKGIYLIFLLLILVGVGSVYFHSTLSLAGQLMDELLILWVVMTSYAILMPVQFLPQYFRTNK
jgi:alkaline ceramidase